MRIGAEILPGGKALFDKLVKIDARAHDPVPAFLGMAETFKGIEARRFAANGPGWLPLADSTITATGSWARQGDPSQILQDTGVLYQSLQGGPGWYTLMSGSMVEMGTRVPYAHWHQTGGTRTHPSGAGWPPQRKIVDLTEKDALAFALDLAAWIFKGVATAKG